MSELKGRLGEKYSIASMDKTQVAIFSMHSDITELLNQIAENLKVHDSQITSKPLRAIIAMAKENHQI